jgi:basic membrane protein A
LTKRNKPFFATFVVLVALVLSACAAEPEEDADVDTAASTGTGAEEVDFLACQVTDTGGVDDKSFNQTAYAGLERAEAELGIEIAVLESQTPNDFTPNIKALLDQECDLIVTVGFLLGEATADAAKKNPDTKFAIVDFDFFDFDAGEDITFENAKELTFQTDEAAFLAGYLAAGMSESGKLGTYGGINIPPVTIFMNGFEAGMDHYNETKGTEVELAGWSAKKQDGLFTGDFENQDNGKNTTEALLQEGADIIMPVAGPVGLGTAAAIQDAGEGSIVWVDTDGCVSAAEFCELFLTSVMKNMDVAVFDAISDALDGTFEGGIYSGNLENGGVGIAPYNSFEDAVPDELKQEVEDLQAAIIAGEISVGE